MKKYIDTILNDNFLNYKVFYILSAISFAMAIISVFYLVLYVTKCDYMLLLTAESCILSSFGLLSMGLSMFYIVGEIQKK
ncbi:MAG: hypothetical protein IJE40_06825 [Clostridia bacterium]|nr:hypothetical protein [Clostridia bacterium]